MRRAWAIIPLLVVALGVLYWSQRQVGPFFVSGLIEAEEVRVGSRVGGRVEEVLVVEGQRVARGETLVVLEPYDLNERLARAQAMLAGRNATLAKLKSGFRTEEIEQARAERDRHRAELDKLVTGLRPLEIQIRKDKLDLARAELRNAESEHARVKRLFEQGQAAQDEADDATRLLEAAQARFAVARDELALAEEGTRPEEIAAARANLARAEAALTMLERGYRGEEVAEAEADVQAAAAEVAAIQRQLNELNIVAPSDSVLEAVDLQPGDLIAANAPAVSLIDLDQLWVRAYVPESRLDLHLGQKVSLRVDCLPNRQFAGHISFISRQAEFTPVNVQTPEERSKQVFRIKVVLDEGRDVLRAGMSADVFLEPGQ
jgi:multidrug resistance efflux pump